MCTGSFVKTLIAQLIYLMLCGIRLIPHGTRLTRVCIFRHTSASSCHGWNSYGTRRPRVCGIPYVPAPRVPTGRALGTHEGRVCGLPVNWGQTCTAKAPPGTRLPRVSCNRANSAQVCIGAKHCPYSWGPSFVRACKLAADVYRGAAPPVLVGREFTPALQTHGRSVPGYNTARNREVRVYGPPANSARVCTRGFGRARTHRGRHCGSLQTRRGCVPGARLRPHTPGPTLRNRASSGRVRCAPGAAVAGTPRCVTR